MAADGEALYGDDTRVTILSCLKENGESEEDLKSTCVPGIVAKAGERKIALSFSDRHQPSPPEGRGHARR